MNETFSCPQIIQTLRVIDVPRIPCEGYAPTYTCTDLTEALHDAFGFRIDNQITTKEHMKKIIRLTKG